MRQIIDFASIGFTCYAQDSIYDPEFTGPRQRARLLKERGHLDLGGVSLDSAKKNFARNKAHEDEKARNGIRKALLDGMADCEPLKRYKTDVPKTGPIDTGVPAGFADPVGV